MSTYIDAAGSFGFQRLPHLAVQYKNQPERKDLFKISAIFKKVACIGIDAFFSIIIDFRMSQIHGHGVSIDVTFPDWGNKSASVVLETTFRAIYEFLSAHPGRQLDTIYLTYDNVNSNKGYILLCGLCSLVLLGVCRKVKITYLITCHTHRDESSPMGVTSKHYGESNETLLTFEAWSQKLIEAIQVERNGNPAARMESSVSAVKTLLHFPDYNRVFKELNFNCANLNGISRAHQIRIAGIPGTERCEIHYKEDVRVNGYYPRATQPTKACREEWKRLFVHEDRGQQGFPEEVECQGMDRIAGQRLSWQYIVKFAGGAKKTYVLKGPSLPHSLCRGDLLNILQDPLPHFSIQDVDFVKLQAAWEKVQEVIRIHGGAEELERMSSLYDDFPVSADDERYTRPIENSTLLKLYNQFGGAMRFKSYEMYQPRIAGCEIVDGITWNGGPLTATQRDLALADAVANHHTSVALLAGVRRRKRQKKTTAQNVLLKNDSNQARLKGGGVENPQLVGIKKNPVTRQQESRSKQYVVSI
jgi:hypothetical protein